MSFCKPSAPPRISSAAAVVPPGEVTFRRGRRNRGRAVARATTDEAGRFRVSLPPGTYCVGVADRALPDAPSEGVGRPGNSGAGGLGTTDTSCLEERQRHCDAVVTVPRSGALTVRTDQPCFGHCYSGPMPG